MQFFFVCLFFVLFYFLFPCCMILCFFFPESSKLFNKRSPTLPKFQTRRRNFTSKRCSKRNHYRSSKLTKCCRKYNYKLKYFLAIKIKNKKFRIFNYFSFQENFQCVIEIEGAKERVLAIAKNNRIICSETAVSYMHLFIMNVVFNMRFNIKYTFATMFSTL